VAHARDSNIEPPWMSSRWRFHPLKILRNTQTWAMAAARAVKGVRLKLLMKAALNCVLPPASLRWPPLSIARAAAAAAALSSYFFFNHTSCSAQVTPFPPAPLHLSEGPSGARQLRVGYVSATGFQGNTTTARFMQRIFSLHDASRVEVICVARAGDDGTTERSFIKEGCKDWLQFEKNDLCGALGIRPVCQCNSRRRYAAAAAINARGVHVLVDLSGWTIFPGVEVFAMKPAPLQL
jgi:predicted O-linked N-acetylglucosamine transferase (SPINDLY family)